MSVQILIPSLLVCVSGYLYGVRRIFASFINKEREFEGWGFSFSIVGAILLALLLWPTIVVYTGVQKIEIPTATFDFEAISKRIGGKRVKLKHAKKHGPPKPPPRTYNHTEEEY